MAKWLGIPVLLCVDAKAMARSLAAEALGFHRFDPDLAWAGLLANRTAGRGISTICARHDRRAGSSLSRAD
jgi:cobyrinic acid a,c-diamide synthase